MDFFGIGNLELVVILLVALLVLGPERMLEMARSVGRFWREAQQTVRYAIDSVTVDDTTQKASPIPREPVEEPGEAVARPSARGTTAHADEDASGAVDAPAAGPHASTNGHTAEDGRDGSERV